MLFKNTLNIFLKKKFELIAVGIIIALSSFIYSAMYYAISGLQEPTEVFFKENKQENFSVEYFDVLSKDEISFINYKYKTIPSNMVLSNIKKENKEIFYGVLNKRISTFEEKFSKYDLEIREVKDVNFDRKGEANKIRFIKGTENINIPLIEEGKYPKKDDEIAITRIYSKKNKIALNDKLTINNKNYKVVGYVLFPDYNLSVFGNDFIIDNEKITIGFTTDEEFDSLQGKYLSYFSGVGKEEFNEKEFNKNVVKTYKEDEDLSFITNIIMTKNQMRSGAIYEEIRSGKVISLALSLIIASIAIMIVVIIIYKILKKEKGQIGVLKALGYSRREIIFPYIIIITSTAFPMLCLGYILGLYAAQPLKNLYLEFYLLPSVPIKQQLVVFFTAVFVPLIFFTALSVIIIMKMISKKVVELLNNGEENKISKVNKIVSKILKNAKAQTKFKYSFIFNNRGKFIVFFFGMFFTSFLIIMSLMFSGFFDKMTTDYYNSVKYNYQGYIDLLKPIPKIEKAKERFITFPNGVYKGNKISILGLDYDSDLHELYNKKDDEITEKLKNGAIVNQSFSSIYGIDKGDIIEIKIGDEILNETVVDISKNYGEEIIYFDREKISNILVGNEDFYNGVYSKDSLNKDDYSLVISKKDILEQSNKMQKFSKISIYGMLISAIFIATIVIYILTSLTVEDNYYNISLLKVMGYNKKEVNKMILNSYFIYAILCYLISIPITVFSMKAFMIIMARTFNIVMPTELKILHVFIGIFIVSIIFYIGTLASKKRINKVPIQEVLKIYRE